MVTSALLAWSILAGPLVGPGRAATVVAPSSGPSEPGLSFGEGVTKRERKPLSERFDAALGACSPPPCVGGACKADEPRLSVVIDGVERDYTLDWELADPRLDAPLTLESTCELCSLVDLEEQLAADLGSLCTRFNSLEAAPGRIRVTSDPSGAVVRVDGRRVGKTPWVGELPPGEHVVELRAPGYVDEGRTLVTVPGVEESEHVELMAMVRSEVDQRPYWPAWTSLGFGVALGLAGTALIAIDGKEWGARCTGSNVDENGHCAFVYATAPLGIALAAVGAASFGTGVGLMVWAQRGRERGGARAAGLSLSGSF